MQTNFYKLLITSALALSFSLFACSTSASVQINQTIYKMGDNTNWSSPKLDDSDWVSLALGLPEDQNNYWVRIKLIITENSAVEQQAIFTSILGSYEIYWDNIKLSTNGAVGKSNQIEVPGSINFQTPIQEKLWTPGKHVISFRISNYHAPKKLRTHYFNIKIAPHQKTNDDYLRSILIPLVILGGLILIGVFFLLLHFRYARKTTYILFSSLCLFIAALLIVELWKPIVGYTYDWHIYRLYIVGITTFLICLLLPIFFIYHFKMKYKKQLTYILFVILFTITFVVSGFDKMSSYLTQASLIFTFTLASWAVFLTKYGAKNALCSIGIVLFMSMHFTDSFQDRYFFPSFSLIIITVLVSLINQLSRVQQQRNQAKLLSAQLEISLLKRSIQPHFILNTLTSIEQWIVESPESAIEFIDALAEEFQQLNNISNKQLIPIEDELELCRSHLKIMGFRHDLQFKLCTKNIVSGLMIPPAIIHTLLENSFTHNQYTVNPTTFFISCSSTVDSLEFIIKSPTSGSSLGTSLNTGTGKKYIESRLTESFANSWSLISELQDDFWVTVIKIPNKPQSNRPIL
jgi:sensor histidine kinase YesM